MIATQNQDFFDKIEGINDNWSNISQLTEKHSQTLLSIYKQYRSNKIDKQQLSDMTTEFVCSHAGEFNDLLKSNFNNELLLWLSYKETYLKKSTYYNYQTTIYSKILLNNIQMP